MIRLPCSKQFDHVPSTLLPMKIPTLCAGLTDRTREYLPPPWIPTMAQAGQHLPSSYQSCVQPKVGMLTQWMIFQTRRFFSPKETCEGQIYGTTLACMSFTMNNDHRICKSTRVPALFLPLIRVLPTLITSMLQFRRDGGCPLSKYMEAKTARCRPEVRSAKSSTKD